MTSQELVDALEENQLLEGVPRRHIRRLAKQVQIREAQKDDKITKEGTFAKEFFFVLSGSARVTVRGRERDTITRGGFFGELAILGQTARTATVTALTEMKLGVIQARDFQELLEGEPKFAVHMVQVLARRLEFLTQAPAGQLK